MVPIIDFLGFNIVLEYDNDLLTIPTTHSDVLLMHLGTEKTNLETYFRNKIQLRNTIIKLETLITLKMFPR